MGGRDIKRGRAGERLVKNPTFEFQFHGQSGEILCRYGGREIHLPWEMSGSGKYDLLLGQLDLTAWNYGPPEPLSLEAQREILNALRLWLDAKGWRTDIDVPQELDAEEAPCLWSNCTGRRLRGLAFCREHCDFALLRQKD